MDEIVVEVKVTYEDYRKCMWFRYMRMGGRAWPSYLLLALLAAAMLCVEAFGLILWGFNASPVYWISVALTILYIPVFISVRYLYIRLGFGKRDQYYICGYSFTGEGIRVEKTGGAAKEYAYGALRRAFETGDAFYLDVGDEEYLTLPKRDMDAETAERLRELLEGKAEKGLMRCFGGKSTK